jgi:hypothetical protein
LILMIQGKIKSAPFSLTFPLFFISGSPIVDAVFSRHAA